MGIKSFVAEKTSNPVVLHCMAPWDWMATLPYAVIRFVGVVIMEPMIMVQNDAIWMPRMGVGWWMQITL